MENPVNLECSDLPDFDMLGMNWFQVGAVVVGGGGGGVVVVVGGGGGGDGGFC